MPDYPIYFKGPDGHFRHVIPLDCTDDDEAIALVSAHADGREMELWQRGLVKAFPARDSGN